MRLNLHRGILGIVKIIEYRVEFIVLRIIYSRNRRRKFDLARFFFFFLSLLFTNVRKQHVTRTIPVNDTEEIKPTLASGKINK